MFDEFDGKQARRTGNSSALGALFDHGCDSFVVTFIVLPTGKLLDIGDSGYSLVMVSFCLAMFFFPVLEEYYVGGLVFGKCNPVMDGSIMSYFLYLYIGIFGNSFCYMEIIPANFFYDGG